MHSARFSKASAFGLLIGLCGCYYNYGYSPYGSSPYGPGSYPAGPGTGYPAGGYPTMTPSPTYVPYGSPGTSPTPLGAPTTSPNWSPAPGGTTLPGNPNNARPYEPPSNMTPGNGLVPNPTNDEEGFGPKPISNSGVMLQPIESGAATGPAIAGNDPFNPALRSVSNGASVAARTTRLSDDGNRKPFGYDLRNYTWLRGYVDFDPQDQRWIMIYSATPDSSDRFGGSLTLADHRLLGKIKPQDHVLIEGAVDAASFDQHGKPMYRIDKMVRLK